MKESNAAGVYTGTRRTQPVCICLIHRDVACAFIMSEDERHTTKKDAMCGKIQL